MEESVDELKEATSGDNDDAELWLVPETTTVYDAGSGEELDRKETQRACELEHGEMEGHDGYELVTEAEAKARGYELISTKWIGRKRSSGGVGSRSTATEANDYLREDVRANVASPKVARLLMSLTACGNNLWIIATYDASVAPLHAELDPGAKLCVQRQQGVCEKGVMMLVRRTVPATCKAGQVWQGLVYETMLEAGCETVEKLLVTLNLRGGKAATGHGRNKLDTLLRRTAVLLRGAAGLVAYVELDRGDTMFVSKVILGGTASAMVGDTAKLKKLGWYLGGVPAVLWCYPSRGPQMAVGVKADDWASKEEIHRSMTDLLELLGVYTTHARAVAQGATALWSGEAELVINRAAAVCLRRRVYAADIDVQFEVEAYLDSEVGRALMLQRGAGKVRHLEAEDAWTQEKVREKEIKAEGTSSEESQADLGAEYLDPDRQRPRGKSPG